MERGRTSTNGFSEALRYWRNARSLLRKCRAEGDFYADLKPVREAFGTAWLAVDTAIKAALIERGLSPRQVPRSWEALLAATQKHLAVHNGRLMKLLSETYKLVHLAGYYYGDLNARPVAESAMDVARRVIETLSRRKIA